MKGLIFWAEELHSIKKTLLDKDLSKLLKKEAISILDGTQKLVSTVSFSRTKNIIQGGT